MTLNKSRYIHLIIMLAIVFGISSLPPFGQITPFGMKVIGAFVAILYGWIFFDLFWTSIFGFMIIPVLGLNTVAGTFAGGLGNQQVINVILSMAFAVAIDFAGVTNIMANWLLQRRILQKSPWFLVCGILVGGMLMGAVGPAMATVFLLWSIVMKIAASCDIKKGEPILTFMITMIAMVVMTATLILPFRGSALVYVAFLKQVTDVMIPTLPFIVFATVMLVCMLILTIFAAKVILKIDASKFVLPETVLEELRNANISKKEKNSFILLIVYIAILLIASLFTSLPGAAFINKLGVGGVSAIATLILAVMNYEGKGYISLKAVFSNLDWSLIFLLAVTFPLADLLKHADSGIMPTIMTFVRPLVADLGLTPFLIISIVILGIITQVTHNIVLGAMFIPFLLPVFAEMGGNIYLLWFALYFVLNTAYCTPAASFQAALVFGHEATERKHAYILGIVLLVVCWISLVVVGIPLGNLIF